MIKKWEVVLVRETREIRSFVGVINHGAFSSGMNKGFSRPRHLQGKGCKTGLCGQAWSFPLFDPM